MAGFTQYAPPYPRYNPQTGQIEMVSASTGQAIPNYNITPAWEQINLQDYGLGLDQKVEDSPIAPPDLKGVTSARKEKEEQEYTGPRLEGTSDKGLPDNYHRDESNNYGYFDKPTGMGFLSSLPGPLGIAGKGINAVVNANNVGAVSAAREDMGLAGLGLKDSIGGTLKDRQGFVANVDYTDQFGTTPNMPVSLEAVQNKSLSPDMIKGLPGEVALSEDQKDPNKTGLFSGIKSAAKSIFDNIFGDDTSRKSNNRETINSTAFGSFDVARANPNLTDFPDAPTVNESNHQKERERDNSLGGRRDGLSDAARDSVDRGTGGLY